MSKRITTDSYQSSTGRLRVWVMVDGETVDKTWVENKKEADAWLKRKKKEYEELAKAGMI